MPELSSVVRNVHGDNCIGQSAVTRLMLQRKTISVDRIPLIKALNEFSLLGISRYLFSYTYFILVHSNARVGFNLKILMQQPDYEFLRDENANSYIFAALGLILVSLHLLRRIL